jgi:hypothetical protein
LHLSGFENLPRAAGAERICSYTFQDYVHLDQHGETPMNHFSSVADEVKSDCPDVTVACRTFEKGGDDAKLACV